MSSGDVHPNPGPNDFDSLISSSDTSGTSVFNALNLSNHLTIVHYNVQRILDKVDIIASEIKCFDVAAFTETWLNDSILDDDLSISGFHTPVRKDRMTDSYGGIIIYVKDNINFKRRRDLEVDGIECIWIELKLLHNKNVLLGVFYRPPGSNNMYNSMVFDSIGLAIDTGLPDTIITGDFNLNTLTPSSSRKISDLCLQFNLKQCIDDFTHFTEHSSSIIDLLFVSNPESVVQAGVGEPFLPQNIRYHCPVFGVFRFQKPRHRIFQRLIWSYNLADYSKLRDKLSSINWSSVMSNDIHKHAKNVTDNIIVHAKECIPNKVIMVRPNDPPWINSEIKRNIRRRKRHYKRAKISNSDVDWLKFRRIRNKVVSLIRASKDKYFSTISDKLISNITSSREWWKTLKTLIKPAPTKSIPPLVNPQSDSLENDDLVKANVLNMYFTSQSSINESNKCVPEMTTPEPRAILDQITITQSDVSDALKCLKTGKAAGPDGINNRVLQEITEQITLPLCDLYNASLNCCQVPVQWKLSNVTAIFKKGDPSLPSNYRPISLLDSLEKVFERIIFKYLFNFLKDVDFFTPAQSGFMPGDSTVNQLTYLYHTFCNALDNGLEVRAVFFDISKAFDKVWHRGLLHKLNKAGIRGKLLSWFKDYLSGRQQRVVIPGAMSDISAVSAGVPQGSILGPLLFLIYINDIVSDLRCNINLFADDTSLFITVQNPTEAATLMQSDIDKISAWARSWLVAFNPSKSESLVVSRKRNMLTHPPLYMFDTAIPSVNNHKHLGIFLATDGSWHHHINYIKEKAWNRVGILRKFKYLLNRKSLETIYLSFIRPVLDYADVVWDNCTNYEKDELEKIQYEAARIITGCSRLVSIHNLMLESGLTQLKERRKNHKLTMFYKMVNNINPPYLSSLVPQTVGQTHRYNLRNNDNVTSIAARTSLYSSSFLPSSINDWNALPDEVKYASTLSTFKSLINKDKVKSNKLYCCGIRRLQVIHTRIRTNCSALSQHLFSKNIIESPDCRCGSVESSSHFFLNCPLYDHIRPSLVNVVSNHSSVSIEHILYGDMTKDIVINKLIFNAVHEFIRDSKRFDY